MPMDFPDFESLKRAAKAHNFRQPAIDELEPDYRRALAAHVLLRDRMESIEIRTGKGWDHWGPLEQRMFLAASGEAGRR